jgi:outer membrane lipoprotein-sorting protein
MAAVPMAVVHSTARAALIITAGEAASITANVSALSEGMLKAMFWTRLKSIATFALMATAGLTVLSLGAALGSKKAPLAASKEEGPIGRAGESPEQIIARMAKTYADARSYEDDGEVTLVFTSPMGRRTVRRPFSTMFVRPKLYRYEFAERYGEGKNERNRFVIWSDAAPERSKSWWTIQPDIKEVPLTMAIAAGTGISGGSAFTVPHLLMPDVLPSLALTGLKDFKLVGEEKVDKAPCDKIEGKNVDGDPETVWIDKATSLVRKIFTTFKVPDAAVEQTTTYRPQVNVEISPKRFVFEPAKP